MKINKDQYKHYLMDEVEFLKQENKALKQIIEELKKDLTIQQIGYNIIQKK